MASCVYEVIIEERLGYLWLLFHRLDDFLNENNVQASESWTIRSRCAPDIEKDEKGWLDAMEKLHRRVPSRIGCDGSSVGAVGFASARSDASSSCSSAMTNFTAFGASRRSWNRTSPSSISIYNCWVVLFEKRPLLTYLLLFRTNGARLCREQG